MRSISLVRRALNISAAAGLLSACGGAQTPIGVPSAVAQNTTRENAKLTYHVLHSFGAAPDGNDPGAGVIGLGDDGTFYGTTIFGGAYSCSPTTSAERSSVSQQAARRRCCIASPMKMMEQIQKQT